jgi:hypothetical protein
MLMHQPEEIAVRINIGASFLLQRDEVLCFIDGEAGGLRIISSSPFIHFI